MIDLSEHCEKCEEQERIRKVMGSLDEQTSCPISSSKIDNRNKVVSGEEAKSLMKEDEREQFKIWYETISRFSKQIRDALLSSESFVKQMRDIHNNLRNLDMKKDNGEVVRKLRDMEDLARMAESDVALILKTLELIEGKVHGNG